LLEKILLLLLKNNIEFKLDYPFDNIISLKFKRNQNPAKEKINHNFQYELSIHKKNFRLRYSIGDNNSIGDLQVHSKDILDIIRYNLEISESIPKLNRNIQIKIEEI